MVEPFVVVVAVEAAVATMVVVVAAVATKVVVDVSVVAMVATLTFIFAQDPSSSPHNEAGLSTQWPEEDQDVRGSQQKQSRQQMGLPQDMSPGALGEPDSNWDVGSVGVTLGWPSGKSVGELLGSTGVLDQIRRPSDPQPLPLVHPPPSSSLVHRRPPTPRQNPRAPGRSV